MNLEKVLIVGGGIAGLTSAIALRAKGFDVDVVEQDPSWSVYGVGIIQQGNVVRAVAQLGVLEDYLAASYPFAGLEMFAPTGAHLVSIPSPKLAGENYPANLGISRPALHKVLGDRAMAAGAKIRLGLTVDRFEDQGDQVAVELSDGSAGDYGLVIGADGLNSKTRSMLFGDRYKPAFTGQAVWRYNLPRPEDVSALHIYTGPNSVGLVPLSNEAMYLFVTSPEPGNPWFALEDRAAEMRSRLAFAGGRIASLREQIVDDAAVVYRPLEALFVDRDWFEGRVVLIGDAAHATTPHLGQGAGMAIEDSLVLADELAKAEDLSTALSSFMARRYERCKFIVEASLEVGQWQLDRRTDVDHPGMVRRMFEVTSLPI